jgi:hypothetical protein
MFGSRCACCCINDGPPSLRSVESGPVVHMLSCKSMHEFAMCCVRLVRLGMPDAMEPPAEWLSCCSSSLHGMHDATCVGPRVYQRN